MVLRNEGGKAGFSSKTSTGSAGLKPRMVAGFEDLTFSLVDYSKPYYMGNIMLNAKENELTASTYLYPNPAVSHFYIRGSALHFDYEILSADGKKVLSGTGIKDQTLDIKMLSAGFYLVRVNEINLNKSTLFKLVKL